MPFATLVWAMPLAMVIGGTTQRWRGGGGLGLAQVVSELLDSDITSPQKRGRGDHEAGR